VLSEAALWSRNPKPSRQGKLHFKLDIGNTAQFNAISADRLAEALEREWAEARFWILSSTMPGMGINAAFCRPTEEQFDTLMNVHVKRWCSFLTQRLRL